MQEDNYYVIQAWMVNKLHLSGNELICYAIINGFSQDGMSLFMGSLSYLQKWMNVSQPTVIKALKSLVEKDLIIKQEVEKDKVRFCYYTINKGTKETLVGGTKETLVGGTKETLDNKDNIYNNKDNNKKNKDKSLSKKAQEGFIFADDKEVNFIRWCNENIPNLMVKVKPLTYKQFISLLSEFTRDEILNKLLYMNSLKGFSRKYSDVHGVLVTWLRGDKDPNYTQRFKNKKNKVA